MKMKLLIIIGLLASVNTFAQDDSPKPSISPWTTSSPSLSTNCKEVACLMLSAYELANCLRPNITSKEYTRVFEPIIFAAAEASDILNDYGPFSADTRDAIFDFVNILEKSEPAINKLMSTPIHFETARKLKRVIRVIKRELDLK